MDCFSVKANQLTWAPVGLYFSPQVIQEFRLPWISDYRLNWPLKLEFVWTLWEDQNVRESVLENMYFVWVLCIFSTTLGWLDDFLEPQFSSSGSDYVIFLKNTVCSKKLYCYLWLLSHKNSRLGRGGYLKKGSLNWRLWGNNCSFIL